MSYSNFQINDILKNFDVSLNERINLFADIPEIEYSEHLAFILQEDLSLALLLIQKNPVQK